jgi:hypothetical protein
MDANWRYINQDNIREDLASTSSASDNIALLGFARSAVGAAAATLKDWHAWQVLNIREMGAVGDDSTNNTAVFTAVVTHLDTLGSTTKPAVYVPYGVFQGTWDLPSDTVLFGDGAGSCLKLQATAGRALVQSADTVSGVNNVTLRNLCIDGNKANQAASAAGFASHGVNIDGPCEGWIIDQCLVRDTQGHGTQIRGGGSGGASTKADNTTITNSYYKDCGYYDVGAVNGREGIYANRSQGNRIVGNLVENPGRQCIALEGSGAQAIATRYNVISNNICRDAIGGGGIDDEADEGGEDVIIGNLCYNLAGTGIRVTGLTGNFLVSGNIIQDVDSRGLDVEVRQTSYAANANIVNNLINGTGTEGIKVTAGAYCTVTGNNIRNAGTVGLHVRHTANDIGSKVSGNTINGSGQEGLVFDRPSIGATCCDNTVRNAGSVAFPSPAYSVRGNTAAIESLVFRGNVCVEDRGTPYTTYAFSFGGLNKPIIDGNSVYGTTATNDAEWVSSPGASTLVQLGNNQWDAARVTGLPGSYKETTVPRPVHVRTTVTYSASMTIDCTQGSYHTITATNGSAFAINAPTSPLDGQPLTITLRNASGGALGAATWNAAFKMSAWTNPANANSRSITFIYNGTNWIQISQTGVDVPN